MEEKKSKETIVKIEDHYGDECLCDSCGCQSVAKRMPRGEVEIYEKVNDGPLTLIRPRKDNLVVYVGREWLSNRAFQVNSSNIDATYDEYISWFGVGEGGAPAGDPFVPIPPTNQDTDLNTPVMINATDSTCADYRTTPTTGYYKHPFERIDDDYDSSNDNKWLIKKVTTTIGADDANGYQISEAGMFTAPDRNGPFHLFSRVTFPTILKDTSRQLVFVWYIYF